MGIENQTVLETQETPKSAELATSVEQAKDRFGSAMFAAFGVIGKYGETECVVYPGMMGNPEGPKLESLAEQAVFELFESGATYHELLAKQEASKTSEYSNEALASERDAHRYRVAAEYVKGLRKEQSSRLIADEVFTEYFDSAKESVDKFLKMQLQQVPNGKIPLVTYDSHSPEYSTYTALRTRSDKQLENAYLYITKKYNIEYVSSPSTKTLQEKFSVETPIKPDFVRA